MVPLMALDGKTPSGDAFRNPTILRVKGGLTRATRRPFNVVWGRVTRGSWSFEERLVLFTQMLFT